MSTRPTPPPVPDDEFAGDEFSGDELPGDELSDSGAHREFGLPEAADTEFAGQRIDEGKGRVYPCDGCGADLKFHAGVGTLSCPYCGHVKEIDLSEHAPVMERDYHATLARVAELREARRRGSKDTAGDDDRQQVTCGDCGATVEFVGSLVSTDCAFCGQPVQIDRAKQVEESLSIDGVLPFAVERDKARGLLRKWVKSRWFAPNEFKKAGVRGKFSGVYLPYWTFDSMTFNRYVGERGENYTVTVGSGKDRRTETRTRWFPASGRFQRFFDDVLVVATRSLSSKLLRKLEPWPLHRCKPYDQSFLAGFLARKYEVDLDRGFDHARERMAEAIRAEVRRRIGGDKQRIHSLDTRHDAIAFKHLLLPVWSLGYKYKSKPYQLVINAVTGEVQGTRPWSFWKIFFAVLAGLAVVGGIVLVSQS